MDVRVSSYMYKGGSNYTRGHSSSHSQGIEHHYEEEQRSML